MQSSTVCSIFEPSVGPLEQVDFDNDQYLNNPYSTTYNHGWRNHPNILWSTPGQGQGNQGQPHPSQSPGIQPSTQERRGLNQESLIATYI